MRSRLRFDAGEVKNGFKNLLPSNQQRGHQYSTQKVQKQTRYPREYCLHQNQGRCPEGKTEGRTWPGFGRHRKAIQGKDWLNSRISDAPINLASAIPVANEIIAKLTVLARIITTHPHRKYPTIIRSQLWTRSRSYCKPYYLNSSTKIHLIYSIVISNESRRSA